MFTKGGTVPIPPQHLQVLERLYRALQPTPILWVLTGSLSFALRGIPVEVHDIDIQTDAPGAYAFEELFSSYRTRPVRYIESARIRSHLGALTIDGVAVEVMGDIAKRNATGAWDPPVALHDQRIVIPYAAMQIPALSLEYEYRAYMQLDRFEQAARLRAWIDSQAADRNSAR